MTAPDNQQAPPGATTINTGGGDVVAGNQIQQGNIIAGSTIKGPVIGGISGGQVIFQSEEEAYEVQGLENPYLGLRNYTYDDRAIYAGRSETIKAAVEATTAFGQERALVLITGSSGSGKSSFAQAGLLPAMEQCYREQQQAPRWAVFKPSRRPLAAFAQALLKLGMPARELPLRADAAPAEMLAQAYAQFIVAHTAPRPNQPQPVNLIVIDQFEELFTQSDPAERAVLLALLANLPPFEQLLTHFIATMRSDYLPELFDHKALFDAAMPGIGLRAMSALDLRAAIQRPLEYRQQTDPRFQGKRFEAELLDQLASDTAEDAAYLPLLQITLEELWNNGRLRRGAYGALTDAIRSRAEAVYGQDRQGQPRPEADQAAVLQIFLDLVNVSLDDNIRRDVRRRRSYQGMRQESADRERLIDELVDARLLTRAVEQRDAADVGTDVVDIIHEALIRSWPRLKQEIARQRQVLRQRARLEQAVTEWIENNRSDESLLSGVRLAEARDLERRGDVALQDPDARELLRRSNARRDAERQRELEQTRALADAQRQRAEEHERARAEAERLRMVAIARVLLVHAGRYQTQSALDFRAALLARQAYLFNQRVQGWLLAQIDETLRSVLADWRVSRVLPGVGATLSLGPDGQTLAAGDAGGSVRLWDLQQPDAAPRALLGHAGAIAALAFSPDGHSIAAGGEDVAIHLWDLQQQGAAPRALLGHAGAIAALAFSPDGRTLAAGGQDAAIHLWDLQQPDAAPNMLPGYVGAIAALAFSPNGRRLAVGGQDAAARLWDLRRADSEPAALKGCRGAIAALAFSPDGRTLAAGDQTGVLRLWNVRQPDATQEAPEHTGAIGALAFSPDGQTLITGGADGAARLWDARQPDTFSHALPGLETAISAVTFSPDGQTLITGGADGAARLWKLQSYAGLAILEAPYAQIGDVAFSPDGQTLAAGTSNGAVLLWQPEQCDNPPRVLHGHNKLASAVAFSPDGRTLFTAGWDRTIRLWDLHQLDANPTILKKHDGPITGLAVSPDGQTLASGSLDTTVRLWDLRRPDLLPRVLRSAGRKVMAMALSPDGQTLATGSDDYAVRLWDLRQPDAAPRILHNHEGQIAALAFSPDGQTLASGSGDRTVRLWSLNQPDAPPTVLRGHRNMVYTLAFSPDGQTLASGSQDQTVRLWDMLHLDAPPRVLRYQLDGVSALAFSPDGRTLATNSLGLDGLFLWDVRSSALAEAVCEGARRNLTIDEWRRHVGIDIPYERTCPALPIHPSVIEAGRDLASSGDLDGAIAIFRRALELDPTLELNPEQEAQKLSAQRLLKVGQNLASSGDLDGAIAIFRRALERDSTLDLNPEQEARTIVAQSLVQPQASHLRGADAVSLIEAGDLDGAFEQIRQALAIDPAVDLTPVIAAGRELSRSGDSSAAAVWERLCQLAPALEPQIRELRGA